RLLAGRLLDEGARLRIDGVPPRVLPRGLLERLLALDDPGGPRADLVAVATVLVVLQDLRWQQVLRLVGVRLLEHVADLQRGGHLRSRRIALCGVRGPGVVGLAAGVRRAGERRHEESREQRPNHRSDRSDETGRQRRGSSTSAVPVAVTSSRWFTHSTAQR